MKFLQRNNFVLQRGTVVVLLLVVIGGGIFLTSPKYVTAEYTRSSSVNDSPEAERMAKESFDKFQAETTQKIAIENQKRRSEGLRRGILFGLLLSSPVLVLMLILILKKIFKVNKKKTETNKEVK